LNRVPADAVAEFARLFTRRAELLRELAQLEEALGRAFQSALSPEPSDEVLGVAEAAAFMGEPVETFRRRFEYRKALLTRPRERRLRYSRVELERIRQDRLAARAVER
jgi:hypothetical protein